jgi:alcohol dehydrogenase class IV
LAALGVKPIHLPHLVPLAAKDFTALTNPRPTVEADYERFFLAAM